MRNGLRIVVIACACCWGGASMSWVESTWAEGSWAEDASAVDSAVPFPGIICEQAAIDVVAALPRPQSGATVRESSQIVIIIDDLGYSLKRGRLATELPGAVTLAILPHSPHGHQLAELAHRQGKEVMLHVPMSNVSGRPLDEGGLTHGMDRATFVSVLRENLLALPHVSGVNNHMGSMLTQEKRPMQWLMAELKSRQLYFVDSRTSADSVAWNIASERGLASLERDFFLDNERDCRRIAQQFALFLAQARRIGSSTAIAHPHPETVGFLQAVLPLLAPEGFHLVAASRLLSSATKPGRPLDSPPDHVGRLQPAHHPGDKEVR